MAYRIHQIMRREMGECDPYQQAKETSTRQALALYPRLKALVAEADDPLETAVRLSIAGNIIDLGLGGEFVTRQGGYRQVKTNNGEKEKWIKGLSPLDGLRFVVPE